MKYISVIFAALLLAFLLIHNNSGFASDNKVKKELVLKGSLAAKPLIDPLDPTLKEDLATASSSTQVLLSTVPDDLEDSGPVSNTIKQQMTGPGKQKSGSSPKLQSIKSVSKPEIDPYDPTLERALSVPCKKERPLGVAHAKSTSLQSTSNVDKPMVDPYDPVLKQAQGSAKKKKKIKPALGTRIAGMQQEEGETPRGDIRDREQLKKSLNELARQMDRNVPGIGELSVPHLSGGEPKSLKLDPDEIDKIIAKRVEREKITVKTQKGRLAKDKSTTAIIKSTRTLAPVLAVNDSVVEITYGSSLDGSLVVTDGPSRLMIGSYADNYSFTGSAGDLVLIDLTSNEFDTYLYLYDPDGNLVAENDDYDGTSRSLISYKLPSGGTYTIEVTSYSESETGNYRIVLSTTPDRSVTEITLGLTLPDSLSDGDGPSRIFPTAFADDYTFIATAGNLVVIDLTSSEFDTYLWLYDSSGNLLEENDDYDDTSRSLIIYEIPLDGTYTIEVTSYSEGETGQYQISLLEGTDIFPDRSVTAITYGDTLEGSLTVTDGVSRLETGNFADDYTFSGSAGDVVRIDLTSSDFDTYIFLYDAEDNLLSFDDDFYSVSHSSIIHTLPMDGIYTVEVTSYDIHETGEYQLTLLANESITASRSVTEIAYDSSMAGNLDQNDGVSRLSLEHFADDFTFTGNAGEMVVIDLVSEVLDGFLSLYDPEGNLVAYNDNFGSTYHSYINHTLASSGTYTIEVTSAMPGETGQYNITLLGSTGGVPDRSVTAITYGDTLEDFLTVTDGVSRLETSNFADDYKFDANAGDSVSIDLTSNEFDTYLYLYDPQGNLVAQNDDFGSTSRSYIWHRLSSGGPYTIEVTSYGGSIGQYQIILLANEDLPPGRSVTEILYGTPLEGSLSEIDGVSRFYSGSFADDYTFDGSAGDTVTIDLTSMDFDAVMFLFDPDGNLVNFAGDFTGSSSSFLVHWLIASGIYTLEVSSVDENATGNYQIRFAAGVEAADSVRSVKELSYGASIEGALTTLDGTSRLGGRRFADDYTFEGNAQDAVAIEIVSEELDTYLLLYGPDGSLLTFNDDYGESTGSYIWYSLSVEGTYTVEVTSYDINETGSYRVSLLSNEDAGPGRSVTVLQIGDTIEGSLSETDGGSRLDGSHYADDFSFNGNSGDVIVVSLESSIFDTYLFLYDERGIPLAQNDDFSGTSQSLITYELQATGAYTVEVTSYESNETGDYRIILSDDESFFPRRSVTGLSSGSSISGTLDSDDGVSRRRSGHYADDYTFEGTEGEAVTIGAESDEFDTYLYLYDSNDILVAGNDDYGNSSNSRIDYTLSTSGPHTVEVTSYDGLGGEYRIRLLAGGDIITQRSSATIASGNTVSGSLDSFDGTSRERTGSFADDFTFSANSGEPLLIVVTSVDVDTYLYLYDEAGNPLAENDDYGGTVRSLILLTPSTSGTYTVEITSYDVGETGQYQIILLSGEDISVERTVTGLSCGMEMIGSLGVTDGASRMFSSGHYADDYTFQGNSGDTLAIDLTSGEFDTYIYLYDSKGILAAENDDYGGITRSFLKYVVPSSGTYTIEVTSFFDNETGAYLIRLLGNEDISPDRSAKEISFGTEKTGSLEETDGMSRRRIEIPADDYTFAGNEGVSVLIDLSTSYFDTYLYLYDPAGNLVAENDDFGGISRSVIMYILPSSGTYTVEVTSYDEEGTGEYRISLLSDWDVSRERSVTEIFYGRTLNESLSAFDGTSRLRPGSLADDYKFTGSSEDSVVIDLESDDFDSFLFLYAPDGTLVAENDDFGSTSRSYIWYKLASSGTYTVEVTSYESNSVGDYRITLLGNEDVKPGRTSTVISYGDSLMESLSVTDGTSRYQGRNFADDYTFEGTYGDSVGIELRSSAFDTYLFLVDPDGDVVAYNDAFGGTSHSYIRYILSSDGTYTIEATSFDFNETGQYQLTLLSGIPTLFADRSFMKISYGEEVSDSLYQGDQMSRRREGVFSDDYTFSGSIGDTVTIDLVSSAFDTYLYLYDPACNLVDYNDDYNESISQSVIIYELRSSGNYTIEITSYDLSETGPYKLTLSSSSDDQDEDVISYGAAISATLTSSDMPSHYQKGSYADIYTLSAESGDSVHIDMVSDDFETRLYLYDKSGKILAESEHAENSSYSNISIRVSSSGILTIEATSMGAMATGVYLLLLNSVEVSPGPMDAGEGFTLIRRGWGLDLSSAQTVDKNLFRDGLPWNITTSYNEGDLLPGSEEKDLAVMGYDALTGIWDRQKVISRDLEANILTFEYISYAVTMFAVVAGESEVNIPMISPVISSNQISPDRTYPLQIKVGYNYPVSNLHGLSFTLAYDSLQVEALSARPAEGVDTTDFSLAKSIKPGKADLKFISNLGEGFFGNGTVAEISLRVRSSAPAGTRADFEIVDLVARDPKGQNIDMKVQNTSVAIETPGSDGAGDVDSNGTVDIFDLLELLKVLGSGQGGPETDVNGDSKTDIFDLLELLKILSGS